MGCRASEQQDDASFVVEQLPTVQHTAEQLPSAPTEQAVELLITLTVNNVRFQAVITHPEMIAYFQTALPMTLALAELNGNEKYGTLEQSFALATERLAVIQPGDLLIYQNQTLVLFYEPVHSHYEYTKIGQLIDPDGLKQALGTGSVTIQLTGNC